MLIRSVMLVLLALILIAMLVQLVGCSLMWHDEFPPAPRCKSGCAMPNYLLHKWECVPANRCEGGLLK